MSSKRLSADRWQQAVDLFERGHGSISALARAFGISRNAMSAGLKRHGAVKACRVDERVEKLNAAITKAQRARFERQCAEDDAKWQAFVATTAAIEAMMQALVAAERDGRLAEFDPMRRVVKAD